MEVNEVFEKVKTLFEEELGIALKTLNHDKTTSGCNRSWNN